MIGVIIQARMGSSRLPGKVLKKIKGIPSLQFQIDRIRQSVLPDKIIVATSTQACDDDIDDLCKELNISCFRGSEDDVLSRYYECAKAFNLKTIIRLTADCPLIDPKIIDETTKAFNEHFVDYCANTVPPETSTWPDGSDVEVFSFNALEKAFHEAAKENEREHVTFFFWNNENSNFKTMQTINHEDWSDYRFTVDYPEDYEAISIIVSKLKSNNFSLEDVINVIKISPEIGKLNSKFSFGEGWNQ